MEEDPVADEIENIAKELPLVLQTSEDARNQIIQRNKKMFQQEAKQTQLEKIIFEIKNDSANKDGSNEMDSADRMQYLAMNNQKTAHFRKNSASGDIRSNSILSSDRGLSGGYQGQTLSRLQSYNQKGLDGQAVSLKLSQTPSVMQIEKQKDVF